jgi:CHAD domain-containing protein
MTLDPEQLDRSPAEGARVVALALCADAAEAAEKLAGGASGEALHDFRVALRRLRSTLRAWKPALEGALREKDEARLRSAARSTGPQRDAEVLLAWLAEARPGLADPYHEALDWLAGRIESRQRSEAGSASAAAARFARRAPRLARRLASGKGAQGLPDAFGAALAAAVRAQARSLRDALAKVASAEDVAHAHRARIEAKRLRYLLEPLRGTPRVDSDSAVNALKGLQDVLGELHDAHVAAAEIAAARVEWAAERARARRHGSGARAGGPGLHPGLLALDRLAAERAEGLFGRLEREYLRDRATPLLDEAYAVVAALETRAGIARGEEEAPQRRFLLADLPDSVRGGDAEEIRQGWLPGDKVRESVGVARSPLGERFFRAVARGAGARRVENEEEISREAFEAFWPLTEGRRVRKRRHLVTTEPGWRFDVYLDRHLFLAVAEPGNDADPPAWLEEAVVREVTGERTYLDEALARRPAKAAAAGKKAEGAAEAEARS